MELPLTTIKQKLSFLSSSPSSLTPIHLPSTFHPNCFPLKILKICGKYRIKAKDRSFSTSPIQRADMGLCQDTEFLEVIGIGSRKDAVLDFCLPSPSLSSRLRFWNIIVDETSKVQLQQRLLEDDLTRTIVEDPEAMESCSKAVILVAGASYGSDLTTVHDIFEAIKLANGFVVMIILKPFRFEGQRRQNEVKDLLNKLKGLTDFCIMVDADALLEKDLVTLDEALQIANNAVLMALNAVSILTSEHNKRFLDIPHESMKELAVTDLKKILGSFKDAKIGYGVGRDVETSVVKAIYDCPFLGSGVKDLSGIVVFILASPTALDRSDLDGILLNFRQVSKWQGDVIISVVHESDMTPGSIATTIFTIGCTRPESSKQDGIFSRLVQRFPFIFNILSPRSQLDTFKENTSSDSTFSSQGVKSESFENPDGISTNGLAEGFHNWSSELQSILRNATDEKTPLSVDDVAEQINAEFPQATLYNESTGGSPTLQRELLINRRPGNLISEETADDTNDSLLVDLKTYKLPVGVKPSGDLKDGPNGSRIMHSLEGNSELKSKKETQFSVNISFDKSTDVSPQAPTGLNSNASSHQNGVYPDVSNKSGRLSARAASILDAKESQLDVGIYEVFVLLGWQ